MEKKFVDEKYLNNIVEQIKNIEISDLVYGDMLRLDKFFDEVDKALEERKHKYEEEKRIYGEKRREEIEDNSERPYWQR